MKNLFLFFNLCSLLSTQISYAEGTHYQRILKSPRTETVLVGTRYRSFEQTTGCEGFDREKLGNEAYKPFRIIARYPENDVLVLQGLEGTEFQIYHHDVDPARLKALPVGSEVFIAYSLARNHIPFNKNSGGGLLCMTVPRAPIFMGECRSGLSTLAINLCDYKL